MWKWQSRAIRRHEERLGGFVQCSDSHGQYHLVNFVRDGDRVSMSVPHEFTGGAAALRLRVAEYKLGGPRAGAYQLELFPENHDLEEDFELADDLVPKVISPPGLRLWHLAEFLCTKKTYASIFYPLCPSALFLRLLQIRWPQRDDETHARSLGAVPEEGLIPDLG